MFGILVLNVYGHLFPRRRGIESGLVALGVSLIALSLAQPVTSRLSFAVPLLLIVIVVAFAAASRTPSSPSRPRRSSRRSCRPRSAAASSACSTCSSASPASCRSSSSARSPTPSALRGSVAGSAIVVLLVAAGSIVRARPHAEGQGSGTLVDALDPVALSGRSLTTPINLHYLEEDDESTGIGLVSVVPGQPGPADDEPGSGPVSQHPGSACARAAIIFTGARSRCAPIRPRAAMSRRSMERRSSPRATVAAIADVE